MYNFISPLYGEIRYYGNLESLATFPSPYDIHWTSSSTSDYLCYKLTTSLFSGKSITFGYSELSATGGGTIRIRIRAYSTAIEYTTLLTAYPGDIASNAVTVSIPSNCIEVRIYVQPYSIPTSSTFTLTGAYVNYADLPNRNVLIPHLSEVLWYGDSDVAPIISGPWSVQFTAATDSDRIKMTYMFPALYAGKTLYLGWKTLGYDANNHTRLEISYLNGAAEEFRLLIFKDSATATNEEYSVSVPSDATALVVKVMNARSITYPNIVSVQGLYLSDESQLPAIVFSEQPQSSVLVHGEYRLTVLIASAAATDDTVVSYQWYVNTEPSTDGGVAISGATSNAYFIASNLVVGNYYFYCKCETATVAPVCSNIAHIIIKAQVPKIYTHKILACNLPLTVGPGEEHWYFTYDEASKTAQMHITAENGDVVTVGNNGSGTSSESEYYNTYTEAAIAERIDHIKALQLGDTITFAVITDIHLRGKDLTGSGPDNRLDRVRDFLMLDEKVPLDYICFLGDAILYGEEYDAVEPRLYALNKTLSKAKAPVYMQRGNHDLNQSGLESATTAIIMNNKQWYTAMQANQKQTNDKIIVNNPACPLRSHFYVDDYANKHRLIFINTYDAQVDANELPYLDENGNPNVLYLVYTTEQLTWLLNEAMDMTGKTDWTVSFFGHYVPYIGASGSNAFNAFHGYGNYSDTYLLDVIEAFASGGVLTNYAYPCQKNDGTWTSDPQTINKDFSAQGAINVTGFYGGHIHDDCYYKIGSLNEFVSTCTCASRRTSWPNDLEPEKLPPLRDTVSNAMSINVVIINKATKTVNVVKIGSRVDAEDVTSSDYEFTYGG